MEQSAHAKIFVTGGAGFVGQAIIDELLARGYDVVALVNRRPIPQRGDRVTNIGGGLFDTDLAHAMAGCAAVIHLVGIIAEKGEATFKRMHIEATKRVLMAAKRAGVKRYVHMSALGTRAEAVSNYHKTKFAAEELVRASQLDCTIFRPSMIHGPGSEFLHWEAAWARGKKAPYFFIPYFGRGLLGLGPKSRIQPVYIGDVARALVACIARSQSIGKIYPLAGPEEMSWPAFHHRCAKAITGQKKLIMPLPAWYAKMLTHLLPAKLLPFNWDQVVMSQEDNVADMSQFISDFAWGPAQLETTLADYAARL